MNAVGVVDAVAADSLCLYLRPFQFLLTEYKDGLEGGSHADTTYAAAFIFRTVPLLHSLMPPK